jgi:IS605 OrfB family transposase
VSQEPLAKNFGGDWGERRLITGAITYLDENGDVVTTGRPLYFDTSDLQRKQGRRRAEGYHLNDEVKRLKAEQAVAARPAVARATKIAVLEQESGSLWQRVSQCDRQVEHAGGKWQVETALAEGATTIVMEDIDSLESRGHGREVNSRCANQPRGGVQTRTREKAEMVGLEVVSVNPRGTSSLCSRCQRKSVFWQASDRRYGKVDKRTGKRAQHQNWLVCEDCRSSDRDHAAGESIGARGFDATRAKRNSRRKPVAGPASHRPVKAESEKSQPKTKESQARETAQAIPFPIYEQAQHTPRSCRAVSSRRVDRGSALPGATQLPERRTLTAREPAGRQPARVLDGMAGGYWRSIQFSRPRALVEPPVTPQTQGM